MHSCEDKCETPPLLSRAPPPGHDTERFVHVRVAATRMRDGSPPPMSPLARVLNLPRDAAAWADGRSWHWRLPLLAWLGYTGFRHLADPDYASLFTGIVFGSHEFGHLFFAFFGEVLAVAGGSLMQLLVPIGAGALLASRRDYFGVVFAAGWLSVSLTDLSRYIGDALAQELPLVSFSPDGGEHDWYWLLDRFELLRYDHRLAEAVHRGSAVLLVASLVGGLWLCIRMMVPAPRSHPGAK